jgi:hypothetical protein
LSVATKEVAARELQWRSLEEVAAREPRWRSLEEASPILRASISTYCNNVGVCRGILPATLLRCHSNNLIDAVLV